MHEHDQEQVVVPSSRPRGARLAESASDRQLRAAVAGRLDVAGSAGLLGVQRAVGNGGAASLVAQREEEAMSPVHEVVRSGGEPLSPDVRADMEGRLGHDFGDVRVHTDGAADTSARAVSAHAYTVGSHIAFQRSAYEPATDQGRTTLAHELVHVVQQRSGPVDGTDAPGGIRVSDPSDRFEREAAATAAQVSSPAAPISTASAQAQVQREAEEPEEPSVQGTFVQREAEEEEEPAG
jgi:hypothetical protein